MRRTPKMGYAYSNRRCYAMYISDTIFGEWMVYVKQYAFLIQTDEGVVCQLIYISAITNIIRTDNNGCNADCCIQVPEMLQTLTVNVE